MTTPLIPQITIRAQTASEEVDYFLVLVEQMKNDQVDRYSWELPDHPVFKNYQSATSNALSSAPLLPAMNEIYDPNFYLSGIKSLEEHLPTILSVFPEFFRLQSLWGFEVLPAYSLCLTRYGPGGYYNLSGQIVMLTRADGSFKHSYPTHTPIHEMVHIGIQRPIVEKFKLSHLEKERLVDIICLSLFPSQLPGYFLQKIGDPRIDEFVKSIDDIANLPEVLEKYVQKYPRQPRKNTQPPKMG